MRCPSVPSLPSSISSTCGHRGHFLSSCPGTALSWSHFLESQASRFWAYGEGGKQGMGRRAGLRTRPQHPYANDAWDVTSRTMHGTPPLTTRTMHGTAFRDAAKTAASEAYANIQNTSLSDLAQSGYNYFLNILSGGDQDKKHLLFENILFDLHETKLHDHQITAGIVLRNIVKKLPSRAGRIYQAIKLYPALPSNTTKKTTRRVRRRQPSPRRNSATKETVRESDDENA